MVGRGWDQKWKRPFILHLLNAHPVCEAQKRGKHGILRIYVRSVAQQSGHGCLRLIFDWSVSWAVFGFRFFKECFLADVPVGFSSVDVCHFSFCRMWTLIMGGG